MYICRCALTSSIHNTFVVYLALINVHSLYIIIFT